MKFSEVLLRDDTGAMNTLPPWGVSEAWEGSMFSEADCNCSLKLLSFCIVSIGLTAILGSFVVV